MSKSDGIGRPNNPFGAASSARPNDGNKQTQNSGQSDTVKMRTGKPYKSRHALLVKRVCRGSHAHQIQSHAQSQHNNTNSSLTHVNSSLIHIAMNPMANRNGSPITSNKDKLHKNYNKVKEINELEKKKQYSTLLNGKNKKDTNIQSHPENFESAHVPHQGWVTSKNHGHKNQARISLSTQYNTLSSMAQLLTNEGMIKKDHKVWELVHTLETANYRDNKEMHRAKNLARALVKDSTLPDSLRPVVEKIQGNIGIITGR